jgi:DNA-binding MarR family transcriptional regulator
LSTSIVNKSIRGIYRPRHPLVILRHNQTFKALLHGRIARTAGLDQGSTSGYQAPMIIDSSGQLPPNTIYGLIQQLLILLDNRFAGLREGTRYQNVRPSDIRVFIQVARQARSETEIANVMNISRQAVQSSVKRLIELKLVEVVPKPNNGRDKIVQMTERGFHARDTAAGQIQLVEGECAAIIGAAELDRLRGLLLHLATAYKVEHFPNPN